MPCVKRQVKKKNNDNKEKDNNGNQQVFVKNFTFNEFQSTHLII
jgi:hypothetical protein